jgi:hypothetical protein
MLFDVAQANASAAAEFGQQSSYAGEPNVQFHLK